MKELFKSFEIKQVLQTQNVQVNVPFKVASATSSQVRRIVYFENMLIPNNAKQKLVLQLSDKLT